MNQVKFFKTITVVLLVLNLAVLSFLFFRPGPPPHHRGKPLFMIIEDKLNLDEQQKEQFKKYREAHHEQMEELDAKRDKLLNEYFKTLKQPQQAGSGPEDLMNEIKRIEQQRVEITYKHFSDVKALCDKDQLAKFPEVLDIAIDHLLKPAKKIPPPPRER